MEGDRCIRGAAAAGVALLLGAAALLSGRALAEPAPPAARAAGRLAALAREVSRVRGLAFTRLPEVRVARPSAIADRIRARVTAQYTAEELDREGQLLGLLGLSEAGPRYASATLEALGEEASGYYDLDEGRLYLADRGADDETLAHELTHALQDQRFDLGRLLARRPGDSDRLAAASAVVEGDATAVASLLSEGRRSVPGRWAAELREALAGGPPGMAPGPLARHLGRSAAFSYGDGLALVAARHRRDGWAGVDALLRSPPSSTEAVLHGGEGGEPVHVAPFEVPGLGEAGRPAHDDTLGRLVLGSALAEGLGREDAASSAEGWRGDRALLFDGCTPRNRSCLVAATVWAGEPTAARFARAFARALERRHGVRATGPDDRATLRLGAEACSLVSRRGVAVAFLEAVPCAALDRAETAAHAAASRALASASAGR